MFPIAHQTWYGSQLYGIVLYGIGAILAPRADDPLGWAGLRVHCKGSGPEMLYVLPPAYTTAIWRPTFRESFIMPTNHMN